jgi:COMPASS component BRE2
MTYSAENKKAYRYTHCIADPLFRHKQFYRQSDSKPYGPRMSVEDSDRSIHFDDAACAITNEKGWRMSRANVFAREGSLYYEVKIINGVPSEGPVVPPGGENTPQPHIRMGWARREAPLDAPVGFDGYSYGITDIRFETMHRSRSAKIALPTKSAKAKSKSKAAAQPVPVHENDDVRTGDVIGLLITLPSLSLHRKVIDGIYNPAVDVSPGFDDPPTGASDIIRDRIPVPYRGNIYFEQFEYQATKTMESYSDRAPINKVIPHPNHEDVVLRSLPHSSIKVYKNGKLIGTAFEKLLSFLPPASLVPASTGARVGFDDGSLGYYPCISSFSGGIAQTNFGPDFWYPPEDLILTPNLSSPHPNADTDINMTDNPEAQTDELKEQAVFDKSRAKGICERYKEQVVEDIVWDIIDESDFFAQDGGYNYVREKDSPDGKKVVPTARGMGLRDE